MEAFENAKKMVEFAGIFMVILPTIVMGTLALKWHYASKSKSRK